MSEAAGHPLDDWARDLGKLVNALQSLEFVLRAFLYEREPSPGGQFPSAHDFYADPVGAVVPVNAITDYRTLGELISAYNLLVKAAFPERAIDPAVVGVRDALAHGRVSTLQPEPGEALDLVKYDRPTKDNPTVVRVAVRVHLTRAWLREHLQTIQGHTLRVASAHEEMAKPGKT